MFDAKAFLKNVPHQPGVYRMLNTDDEVLYVGKAKDLRKRLSSYFRSKLDSLKTSALVSQIVNVEYTLTHSETEALLLENNLIKEFLPKYNVLLRDDKSYPYILISAHKHPRISSHRGPRKDKGQYFGPYPNAGAVWQSLKSMQKIFPIRQCEDGFYRARTRPCLQYQLKLCSAPCVGKISDEDYAEQVRLASLFLSGKNQQVIEDLVQKMSQASEQLQFERAAQYRDQIGALRKVQEQQYVSGEHEEMDIIGFASVIRKCWAVSLIIRKCRLILQRQRYCLHFCCSFT
jgi:excinuclease ABC subunit C